MDNPADTRLFFVGICGTGMSSLAVYFSSMGYQVAGSDASTRYYTAGVLSEAGITVFQGFSADRFSRNRPHRVIYSAAYSVETHEELKAARRLGIPCSSYPEMLGELSRQVSTICIAGSHGKTTTSVMTLLALSALKVSGAPLVGTVFSQASPPYDVLVMEACEYRRHFLHYDPEVSVITSVDHDHVDFYQNFADCVDAFSSFAARTSKTLIAPLNTGIVFPEGIEVVTCSTGDDGDYRVVPSGTFDAQLRREYVFFPWGIRKAFEVPGDHIARNALLALCAVQAWAGLREGAFGKEKARIALEGIASYQGSPRRFERIGEAWGVLIYDDYAHHPTEIEAVISGIRDRWPGRRLVVDFVPHTFSRTQFFLKKFATALSMADEVILQDIYGSMREQDSSFVTSGDLAALIPGAKWFRDYDASWYYLERFLHSGDVFITMGAGDNRDLSKRVYEALLGREQGGI